MAFQKLARLHLSPLLFAPFRGKLAVCNFLKSPFYDTCFWFFRCYVFPSAVSGFINIADWSCSHPPAFFFGSTHSIENIQCKAVIFHFWSCQVKRQHHFVFWNRRV